MQSIRKIAEKTIQGGIAIRPPKPFPGRYPTRWLIIRNGGGTITKPCWTQASNKPVKAGEASYYEFDRAGVIRSWDTFNGYCFNSALMKYYYPWSSYPRFYLPWNTPLYPKLLETRKRKWVVYSPFESMNNPQGDQMISEYNSWLRRSGLLKELK